MVLSQENAILIEELRAAKKQLFKNDDQLTKLRTENTDFLHEIEAIKKDAVDTFTLTEELRNKDSQIDALNQTQATQIEELKANHLTNLGNKTLRNTIKISELM